MKLPFTIPFRKQDKKEYFLALLLREEKVSAVIFEESSGKMRVVGEHEKHFASSIEHASTQEFLETLDEAISTAESNLPENVQTHKTIFGVKEDWVEGSKIKKDYLLKLKKISDELDLAPVGFLIIQEAIAHLMQKEEGAPVSAILVEVGRHNLALSLLRAGRILDTKRTKLEEDVPKTTDRILHHFTEHEVLPSRIVIFDDDNAEKLSQAFIAHSWSKSLPFLHVPQITVLPKDFDAKAILFGAAIQMGFEILGNLNAKEFNVKENQQADPIKEDFEKKLEKQTDEDEIENENKEKTTTDETEEKVEETFGFLRNEDIVASTKQSDHNIKHAGKMDEQNEEEILEQENIVPITEQQEKILENKANAPMLQKVKNIMQYSINLIKKLIVLIQPKYIKFLRFPKISSLPKKGKIFFIPPLIIFFLIFILLLYIFKLKATIILSFTPKVIEQNQKILFSTSDSTDFVNNRINVSFIDIEESGSISVNATGKKEIGDKAKGSITIFNSSLSEGKTFPKGTTIKSSNDLDFVTDNAVTVASASGDASSIQSSNAKVSVTAKNIGKEYNLPSGTKFSVESLPNTIVIAKNDTAFSGGSKKEVTVIAKDDLQKAIDQLPKDLEQKAEDNIAGKITSDQSLLYLFPNELTKKEFSKNAGEEADTLTLNGTVSYRGILYAKEDLNKYAKNLLATKQEDMIFSENGITYSVDDVGKKNEKEVNATVKIKAGLIPKIDVKKLAEQISGKSFLEAETLLVKLPQASDVRITLLPNIPLLPKVLPRVAKNIDFSIKAHD